jgi:hypothetical protein
LEEEEQVAQSPLLKREREGREELEEEGEEKGVVDLVRIVHDGFGGLQEGRDEGGGTVPGQGEEGERQLALWGGEDAFKEGSIGVVVKVASLPLKQAPEEGQGDAPAQRDDGLVQGPAVGEEEGRGRREERGAGSLVQGVLRAVDRSHMVVDTAVGMMLVGNHRGSGPLIPEGGMLQVPRGLAGKSVAWMLAVRGGGGSGCRRRREEGSARRAVGEERRGAGMAGEGERSG